MLHDRYSIWRLKCYGQGLFELEEYPLGVNYIAIGSIIIDNIVLSDGQTQIEVLGGGALHAASGMRVWADSVGLISAIGSDFPPHFRSCLGKVFDLHNVATHDLPTPRALQVFDTANNRTEQFLTDWAEFIQFFDPHPSSIGNVENIPSGVFLLGGQPNTLHTWITYLRTWGNSIILWEPWDIFMQPESLKVFCEIAPLVDIFSPNLLEARRLTGEKTPDAVVRALLAYGARVIALRMGEQGSLIACDAELIHVPALSFGPIVDVTGAGNSYGGGFIVGLVESNGNLQQAGLYGAVAASFALEQVGVFLGDFARSKARRRYLMAKKSSTIET
ncbi:MAG TPA: PfkB family carbohydrate kinase [Anaerolineales bacterium]|nr:PfkB family carbohydrate kinase [Anaerolineales bacterium]